MPTDDTALHLTGKTVSLAGRSYTIGPTLGRGSFGVVYMCLDVLTGQPRALKVEVDTAQGGKLVPEYKTYERLQSVEGVPRVYGITKKDGLTLMGMDLLGPSLKDVQSLCGKFTVPTACSLALQLIQLLRQVHHNRYIHRDIKPSNFLIGLGERQAHVFAVDFGLASRYRDNNDHHIMYREKVGMTGTARFVSVNVHLGVEQSRRDDMESLGYMLIYFLKGRLPWTGLQAKTRKEKHERISESKMSTPIAMLCESLPSAFREYMESVRKLRFEEKPHYDEYINLFSPLVSEEQLNKMDWLAESRAAGYAKILSRFAPRAGHEPTLTRNASATSGDSSHTKTPAEVLAAKKKAAALKAPGSESGSSDKSGRPRRAKSRSDDGGSSSSGLDLNATGHASHHSHHSGPAPVARAAKIMSASTTSASSAKPRGILRDPSTGKVRDGVPPQATTKRSSSMGPSKLAPVGSRTKANGKPPRPPVEVPPTSDVERASTSSLSGEQSPGAGVGTHVPDLGSLAHATVSHFIEDTFKEYGHSFVFTALTATTPPTPSRSRERRKARREILDSALRARLGDDVEDSPAPSLVALPSQMSGSLSLVIPGDAMLGMASRLLPMRSDTPPAIGGGAVAPLPAIGHHGDRATPREHSEDTPVGGALHKFPIAGGDLAARVAEVRREQPPRKESSARGGGRSPHSPANAEVDFDDREGDALGPLMSETMSARGGMPRRELSVSEDAAAGRKRSQSPQLARRPSSNAIITPIPRPGPPGATTTVTQLSPPVKNRILAKEDGDVPLALPRIGGLKRQDGREPKRRASFTIGAATPSMEGKAGPPRAAESPDSARVKRRVSFVPAENDLSMAGYRDSSRLHRHELILTTEELDAIMQKEITREPRKKEVQPQLWELEVFFGGTYAEIVEKRLYLGSEEVARNATALRQLGITAVVSATSPAVSLTEDFSFIHICVGDVSDADISAHFLAAAEFIDTCMRQGGTVLVHCQAGVSRSTTLLLFYLMKCRRLTLKQAYMLVKKRRPVIAPNIGFWRALQSADESLHGECSMTVKEYALINMQDRFPSLAPRIIRSALKTASSPAAAINDLKSRFPHDFVETRHRNPYHPFDDDVTAQQQESLDAAEKAVGADIFL